MKTEWFFLSLFFFNTSYFSLKNNRFYGLEKSKQIAKHEMLIDLRGKFEIGNYVQKNLILNANTLSQKKSMLNTNTISSLKAPKETKATELILLNSKDNNGKIKYQKNIAIPNKESIDSHIPCSSR